MRELLPYPMRTKQGGCKQGAKQYHPHAGSSGGKVGELSAWDDDKSIATGTRHFNTSANIRLLSSPCCSQAYTLVSKSSKDVYFASQGFNKAFQRREPNIRAPLEPGDFGLCQIEFAQLLGATLCRREDRGHL